MEVRIGRNRAGTAMLALAAACVAWMAGSGVARAAEQTFTYREPIDVKSYEVKQAIVAAEHPDVAGGYVTKMETDLVDEDGTPIPISRLMLHHIVYLDLAHPDTTCETSLGWDSRPFLFAMPQRFYAAGEERAKLRLPAGYGYELGSAPWLINYMVMNHRSTDDAGFIEYKVTVSDDPGIEPVTPYWMDVRNCRADPIYNVQGTNEPGTTNVKSSGVTMPTSSRIVAAGGHMHGGGKMLTLTQPGCDDRELGRSTPTWGLADHPFYNVRPILHEPGPIDMSAFGTETGIPIQAGERIQLNSIYDAERTHVRVMGIMVVYAAEDPGIASPCGAIPEDVEILQTSDPGRHSPVPFRIPIYGLDADGNAVEINAPPGSLQTVRSGATLTIDHEAFLDPNVKVRKGARLNWAFVDDEVHNVTLANGPRAIGSPNLNGSRVFSAKLPRSGTYRLFCGLHPVEMTERIKVVKPKRR